MLSCETVAIQAPGVGPDFVEVYERHYGRVVRALQISGLDRASAEDVAQEAFARTLGHWTRVRTGTNPPGYVYKAAFRLARRSWQRPANDPLPMDVPVLGDVGAQAVTWVAAERVLAGMPSRRRSCAVMCFVVGLSTKEAARALGIAEGTVRKQLELARRSLEEGLAEGP